MSIQALKVLLSNVRTNIQSLEKVKEELLREIESLEEKEDLSCKAVYILTGYMKYSPVKQVLHLSEQIDYLYLQASNWYPEKILEFPSRKSVKNFISANWVRLMNFKIDLKIERIETSLRDASKDAHTEHCCVDHGCKYQNEDCSVITGEKLQSFPCEYCEEPTLLESK